jgi:hypothetical protein
MGNDALMSPRPYKEPWDIEQAAAEIEKGAGSQFDPTVVEAFLSSRPTSLPASTPSATGPASPARRGPCRRAARCGEDPHPLPARAERLPALRPRQVDLPELRPGRDYGGACHLRFDDTNPEKEEQEYVDAIVEAVQWLGFDWGQGRATSTSPRTTSTGCTPWPST